MTASRETLLPAMQSESDFLNILKLQCSEHERPDFAEAFIALNQKGRRTFCQRWRAAVERGMNEICKPTADADPIGEGSSIILGSAVALIGLIGHTDFAYEHDLLLIVTVLHDRLMQLSVDVDELKNRICQVCERWWLKDLDSKHLVAENAVRYLMQRTALRKKVTKVDIKRLYSIRKCLVASTVHRDDHEIRHLLTKCTSSSRFLQDTDGRKFIAFVFIIGVDLVNALHYEVKIKLVDCSKLESSRYGEIYLRAWLSANDIVRNKLEDCIQDIIEHAIGASTPKLFASLCRFLVAINCQKTDRRLGDLLARLYAPILWRSLKTANGTVRNNATSIFFAIFPLDDPSAKSVEADEDIRRQINVVEDLLFDPYPLVRARAALGTGEILNAYWEMIPPAGIRSLASNLVEKLAFDAASVRVRISVFKGLSRLIDNPMSHPLLRSALPKVGRCIHDVAESVRTVFVELLLKLADLRQIKFWDVVPMDELLMRLAVDTQAVGRRIARLIRKSYHPTAKGNEVLLERTIHLIATNRAASRCFYLHARHFLSVAELVNYMLLVCRCLHMYAMAEFQKEISRGHMDDMCEDPNDKDEDETERDDSRLSLDDGFSLSTDVIAGLIDTVSILWATLRPEFGTDEGKTLHDRLCKRYVAAVPKIHKLLKDSDAAPSVLYLSSFLPSSRVSMSVGYCTSQLRSLQPDGPPENYENLLECMCNWGRSDDVLELVTEWLDAGFSNDFVTPVRTKARPSGHCVRFAEPREPRPRLAVDMLTFMLRQASCRNALLNSMRTPLVQMTQRLRKIQKVLNDQLAGDEAASCAAEGEHFSLAALGLMYKLCVLLHGDKTNDPPFDGVHVLSVTLRWVENQVLPRLAVTDDANSSTSGVVRLRSAEKRRRSTKRPLALDIVRCSLDICRNTVQVGVVDIQLASQISNLVGSILAMMSGATWHFEAEEDGHAVIRDVCSCIGQLLEYGLVSDPDGRIVHETTVPALIGAFLKCVRAHLDRFPDAKLTVASTVQPAMTDILNNYSVYTSSTCRTLRDVLATMMAIVFSDLVDLYDDDESEDVEGPPESVQCLPALSYVVLSVVVSKATIIRPFLRETITCLQSGAVCDPSGLQAGCSILSVLRRHKGPVADIKEAALVLEDLIVRAHTPDAPATDEVLKSKIKRLKGWLASIKKSANILTVRRSDRFKSADLQIALSFHTISNYATYLDRSEVVPCNELNVVAKNK